MNAPSPSPAPRTNAPWADPSALDAAKAKVGTAAKLTIDSVRDFAERAAALLSASEVLRETARRQTSSLADQQARTALSNRPVADLRNLVGKGARLNALADAGYRTVADVADASAYQLQAVQGIGPQTAQQVSSAARRLAQQVRSEI